MEVFTFANCLLTLSINIVNDYMCESIEDHNMKDYAEIQSKFEFVRITSPYHFLKIIWPKFSCRFGRPTDRFPK